MIILKILRIMIVNNFILIKFNTFSKIPNTRYNNDFLKLKFLIQDMKKKYLFRCQH